MLTGEEGFSDSGTDDGVKNNQKAKLMRTQARGQRQFSPIKLLPLSHIAYNVNLPRLRILAREGSVFFVAQWLKSRVSYPRSRSVPTSVTHRSPFVMIVEGAKDCNRQGGDGGSHSLEWRWRWQDGTEDKRHPPLQSKGGQGIPGNLSTRRWRFVTEKPGVWGAAALPH